MNKAIGGVGPQRGRALADGQAGAPVITGRWALFWGAAVKTPRKSGKHAQQLLKLIEIGGNTETRESHRLGVVTVQVRTRCGVATTAVQKG
jgi:hypothetical protein